MNVDYEQIDNINWEQFKIDAQKELEQAGGKYLNISCWTDVYPCLILEIKGKKMIVEELEHIADHTMQGGQGHQNWIIFRSEQPRIRTFTLRKNGDWTEQGSAMGQGYRGYISELPCYYHDWEF